MNCNKYGTTFESHLLIPCTREDFEEQESNIDSEEEVKDIPLQDPLPFEGNNKGLDWCHKLSLIRQMLTSL